MTQHCTNTSVSEFTRGGAETKAADVCLEEILWVMGTGDHTELESPGLLSVT